MVNPSNEALLERLGVDARGQPRGNKWSVERNNHGAAPGKGNRKSNPEENRVTVDSRMQ
jgi:hypothetical protein